MALKLFNTITDKCSFCEDEKETFSLLLCSSIKIASFWDNVSSWIESKLKCRLVLQPFNMLFSVGCNYKFYAFIYNCLPLQARLLICRPKTA